MPRKISKRAARVWQRLSEWYGTRMAEQYGAEPPEDWADVVDRCDDEQIKLGLAKIRTTFVQHPPTLPQFEQTLRPPHSFAQTGPTAAERLCAYAAKRLFVRLTPEQLRGPWTYLAAKETGEIIGMVIDPDGQSPGHRINLMDIQTEGFI